MPVVEIHNGNSSISSIAYINYNIMIVNLSVTVIEVFSLYL